MGVIAEYQSHLIELDEWLKSEDADTVKEGNRLLDLEANRPKSCADFVDWINFFEEGGRPKDESEYCVFWLHQAYSTSGRGLSGVLLNHKIAIAIPFHAEKAFIAFGCWLLVFKFEGVKIRSIEASVGPVKFWATFEDLSFLLKSVEMHHVAGIGEQADFDANEFVASLNSDGRKALIGYTGWKYTNVSLIASRKQIISINARYLAIKTFASTCNPTLLQR